MTNKLPLVTQISQLGHKILVHEIMQNLNLVKKNDFDYVGAHSAVNFEIDSVGARSTVNFEISLD